MANNKVIYLNEDTQELTSERDVESQFADNTQFNTSVPGESNYSVGGKQDAGYDEGHDDIDNGEDDVADNLDGGGNIDLDNTGLTVEDKVNMSNVKLKSDNIAQNGGDDDGSDDGSDDGASNNDISDAHSVSSADSDGSSVNTADILENDPMYIRLTKFLQTGGDNKKNMAEILLDISNNFTKLNENLENLSNKMTKMSLQQ